MPFFSSSAELQKILGGFFQELVCDGNIRASLVASGLIIKFSYEQPELSITIDARNGGIEFHFNDRKLAPDVDMRMKADIAHRFWLGKVNLMIAIARRQIIAKGQIPKVLKLLPVVKPAYKLYPEYLKKNGYSF